MTRRKREIVGLTNERDFPHLVELALPPGGFRTVFLELDAFHREQRIPVRRGRSRHEDEQLDQDELVRCDKGHRYAEHLNAGCVLEPLIAHRHAAVQGGEDHVEEVLATEDFGEPTLVLNLNGVAKEILHLESSRDSLLEML
jgi:hypothetical protein